MDRCKLSKVHNSIIAGNVDLANLPDDIAGDGLDLTSSYNLIGSGGSGGLTDGGTSQNIVLAAGEQPAWARWTSTGERRELMPCSIVVGPSMPAAMRLLSRTPLSSISVVKATVAS